MGWGGGVGAAFQPKPWVRCKFKTPFPLQFLKGTDFQAGLANADLQVFLMYLHCCSSSSLCSGELAPPVKASHEHPHVAHNSQQWGQAAHASSAVEDNFGSSLLPSGSKGVKANGVESWGAVGGPWLCRAWRKQLPLSSAACHDVISPFSLRTR